MTDGFGEILDNDPRLEDVDRYEIYCMVKMFEGLPEVQDELRTRAADAFADDADWELFDEYFLDLRRKYRPDYGKHDFPEAGEELSEESTLEDDLERLYRADPG